MCVYISEWSMDRGGYISYVAKGEDEEVGSDLFPPTCQELIVYRQSSIFLLYGAPVFVLGLVFC